jgi:polyphosphate kinase 2 (PPK2 family)
MLNQTTTAWAPWHVIPADQKWYRNLAVTRTIVSTLKELDPKYPKPEQDLTDVTVE